jgi:large subunit ribosomal protein L21
MAVTEKKKKETPVVAEKNELVDFAVIKTGGKQYKVKVGETVRIEKIADKKKGDKVEFPEVILVDDGKNTKVGTPIVTNAIVEGEVTDVGRNQKVVVIHYKQKSRYYKKAGHRQHHLKVKITKIKS